MALSRSFDVAIIGAGVVGCAILREFTLAGLSCILLERGPDILCGASKGNSAILHTGFDAPPGSLEHNCIRQGYARYLQIREKLNLPIRRTSALVVAWDSEQLTRLPAIVEKAHANGVQDLVTISREELLKREPNLSPRAHGAVLVPGESVIDAWSAPLAYVHQAIANGATVVTSAEVSGGTYSSSMWTLQTTAGAFTARSVINCAGNFGDHVEQINRPSPFKITPRKGQYLVFDKPAAALFKAIILPVPTQRTKGVVVCPTIYGNVLVGPTAEDQEDRQLAEVSQAMLLDLKAKGEAILPGLAAHHVNATYAGLRPATQFDSYQVESQPARSWITVAGIRSTGLSASLGIAQHVLQLYHEEFEKTEPLKDPKWTPVPNLAEHRPRPHQQTDCGEIVCYCEMVTRKEIEATFSSPLPPGDLAGLKRRTRCSMGRCQAYYCGHKVARLTEGRLKPASPHGERS